uniref:B-cell receptor CD22 n=1 Tax=Seriola lalandi dorsalis TaxID=1841481 RepID=A0A3B4Z0G7_SERLL
MRIAAQTVVGWLVFLALIKSRNFFSSTLTTILAFYNICIKLTCTCVFTTTDYSTSNSNPFELTPSRLTAKEGLCAEIKCIVSKAVTVDGAYWFWMKDGKWNDTVKDFTGTIVYSSNFSRRLVSSDFEGRVKYFGSSSSLLRNQYQPFCSILICDLKKSDSGEFSFRFEGNKKWVTKKNVSLEVQENPCLLTFQKPPAVNESDTITLTCSTLRSCNSKLQIQDLGQSQPLTQSYSVKQHEKSTTVSFTTRLQDNGKVFLCQTEGNEDRYSIRNISVTVEYVPRVEIKKTPPMSDVKEGDKMDLTCDSYPSVTSFTWMKITDGKHEPHKTTQTLTIKSASPSDSGWYSCEATNEIGTGKSQPVEVKVKCE